MAENEVAKARKMWRRLKIVAVVIGVAIGLCVAFSLLITFITLD